tara:strand:+ start:151 stop:744 length:594 start_codon:yes stop_codon:yes gene_type:complete
MKKLSIFNKNNMIFFSIFLLLVFVIVYKKNESFTIGSPTWVNDYYESVGTHSGVSEFQGPRRGLPPPRPTVNRGQRSYLKPKNTRFGTTQEAINALRGKKATRDYLKSSILGRPLAAFSRTFGSARSSRELDSAIRELEYKLETEKMQRQPEPPPLPPRPQTRQAYRGRQVGRLRPEQLAPFQKQSSRLPRRPLTYI